MPKIGGHVSAAVSLETSFIKAQEIGAEAMQIFVSPPRQWAQTVHDDEEINRFLKAHSESGVGPNFIHGTYLVNLGTESGEHLQKSIDWLIWAMKMAEKLQMRGVIFHPGSFGKRNFEEVLSQIVEALKSVLRSLPKNGEEGPYLILENSAGAGGNIGSSFKQFGEILRLVGDDRLRVCLDTQHSFAAGYDVKTALGLKDVLEEFEQEIGLKNLVAIHCNDSKTEYKSHRDRHENIGEGFIGREGFENMINHPLLKEVPFILEVPGIAGNGPDKENVSLLKSLVR